MFLIKKETKGFALAEILVALMVTTMAIVLVGALSQQVMNMNKNSKQIAAVIEMRAKIAALSKNPDTFLTKMRAVIPPGSGGKALQSCIPFVSASVTSYSCPAVLNATELAAEGITNEDTENGRYKVSKTPVVDSRGAVIAPQYLTDNGSVCSSANPATECPFMSEGYMFRENELGNPGDVKFVSRVSMNPGYSRKGGTTPLKPMLMSVELGSGWSKASTQSCSSSKVFQGIEPDGTTKCVDATKPCASGLIQVGYDSNGPLCENPSLLTCEANEKPILDPVGKKLICSSSSPCAGSGKVFTGFYAASGEPICENPSEKCTSGSIQMGTHSNNAPLCVAVEACDPLEAVTYDGTKFKCYPKETLTGENGKDGLEGKNGITFGLPTGCLPGMTVVVNSSGTGLSCVPKTEDPKDPPVPGCKENPALCPVDPVCETGTLGNDAKRVYVKSWTWTPSSSCEDGYVLQNSSGVYAVRTYDERPLGASLPIDIKFATYHEPDGLRVVADGVYGSKVLFSTCRLSTHKEGGTQYGLKKPPEETIRSFSVRVPEGTTRIRVNRKNNDSPTYLSLRGFCRTFKEVPLNPFSGAKTGLKIRNEYQSELEGYKRYE